MYSESYHDSYIIIFLFSYLSLINLRKKNFPENMLFLFDFPVQKLVANMYLFNTSVEDMKVKMVFDFAIVKTPTQPHLNST